MITRRAILVVLIVLALPLVTARPGWGLAPGDTAPDVRVFNPVEEEALTLYEYLGDQVGLLWVWTDQFA